MKNKIFSEIDVRYYLSQILEAFKLICKRNIVHRDIKPENIFMNNGQIKVGDFGLAKQNKKFSENLDICAGTITTMAP